MPNYIKHGPKGLNKTVETIDEFVNFIKAYSSVDTPIDLEDKWEFSIVTMSEKEFNELPEFEGF